MVCLRLLIGRAGPNHGEHNSYNLALDSKVILVHVSMCCMSTNIQRAHNDNWCNWGILKLCWCMQRDRLTSPSLLFLHRLLCGRWLNSMTSICSMSVIALSIIHFSTRWSILSVTCVLTVLNLWHSVENILLEVPMIALNPWSLLFTGSTIVVLMNSRLKFVLST